MVQVPVSLLQDPGLSESAKLIRMVLHLPTEPLPALVEKQTCLSRKTVLKGLAQVRGYTSPAGEQKVRVPVGLLTDSRVGARAKVLYCLLRATPDPQFTYAQLGELSRAGRNAVKRAVRDLVDAGWLQVTQETTRTPLRFAFPDASGARSEAEVTAARERVAAAPHTGEALMREFLSLLVDSDLYEDNFRPRFLVNPFTGERMELDRYYHQGVAFEYNGAQHDHATEFATDAQVAKQQARDDMKRGICERQGIRLVVVRAQDLTLAAMRQKVCALLPLRDPDGHQPLVAVLEASARGYRRKAMRKQKARPRSSPTP